MKLSWRFLDTGEKAGAFNMRCDELLASDLQRGESGPALRLYRWKPWAISLGYNQNVQDVDGLRCKEDGIDVVRRPTGGRAILHAEELTYCVVMPGQGSVLGVYNLISQALVKGLALFGVDVAIQRSQPDFGSEYKSPSSIPCFTSSARYEIEWEGRKLVGSAQRRYRWSGQEIVLQHGSILAGPAHRRLVRYLQLPHERMVRDLDDRMARKTVDLSEILQRDVDMLKLAACVRRGFEEEWGIEFTHSQGATHAEIEQ